MDISYWYVLELFSSWSWTTGDRPSQKAAQSTKLKKLVLALCASVLKMIYNGADLVVHLLLLDCSMG